MAWKELTLWRSHILWMWIMTQNLAWSLWNWNKKLLKTYFTNFRSTMLYAIAMLQYKQCFFCEFKISFYTKVIFSETIQLSLLFLREKLFWPRKVFTHKKTFFSPRKGKLSTISDFSPSQELDSQYPRFYGFWTLSFSLLFLHGE